MLLCVKFFPEIRTVFKHPKHPLVTALSLGGMRSTVMSTSVCLLIIFYSLRMVETAENTNSIELKQGRTQAGADGAKAVRKLWQN